MITVAPHPKLDLGWFTVALPAPLGALASPPALLAGLGPAAPPLVGALSPPDDAVRAAVRDLLRVGGFKPTGRSKPASEYLLGAAAAGTLGPINPVVDACNVASLHSGLPISVVDLDRVEGDLRVEIAPKGTSYVFNASGQEIDVGGLVGLADALGPCANAVKDSQRTKTSAATRRALAVVWGTVDLPGRTAATVAAFLAGLATFGATAAVAAPGPGPYRGA